MNVNDKKWFSSMGAEKLWEEEEKFFRSVGANTPTEIEEKKKEWRKSGEQLSKGFHEGYIEAEKFGERLIEQIENLKKLVKIQRQE